MRRIVARLGAIVFLTLICIIAGGPAAPTAAFSAMPTLTAPAEGATLTTFGPTLTWTSPAGATQYHLKVTPANNDGPGINIIRDVEDSFTIPAPPIWAVMLPDMSYTWQVRVTDKTTSAPEDDASWGPWAIRHFRTPAVTSSGILPLTPTNGDVVTTLTPTLQWGDTRFDVFYYEFQLSKDQTFNTDPATATAMVYTELRHGLVTRPLHSYTAPKAFPLEDGTTYYWRVRPRVQGDGTPVAWSATNNFRTSLSAAAAFTVQAPQFGASAADATTCKIASPGATFASTPALTGLHYAIAHAGTGIASLNFAINDIPAAAFAIPFNSTTGCFRTTLGRPGGGPDDGRPLSPAIYRVEVWVAGQLAKSGSVTIAPASELAVGPISVGTAIANSSRCELDGVATEFPAGGKTLYFRWNVVGSGAYTAKLYKGTAEVASSTFEERGPSRCVALTSNPTGEVTAGTWKREISINGKVVQSTTFTVK